MLHQIGTAQCRRTRDTANAVDENHAVRPVCFVDELTGAFEVRCHAKGHAVFGLEKQVFDMSGNGVPSWWSEDDGENVCDFQTSKSRLFM